MGRSWALSEIVVPKPSYCFSAFRTSDFLSANLSRSNKSPEARRISITASIFFFRRRSATYALPVSVTTGFLSKTYKNVPYWWCWRIDLVTLRATSDLRTLSCTELTRSIIVNTGDHQWLCFAYVRFPMKPHWSVFNK